MAKRHDLGRRAPLRARADADWRAVRARMERDHYLQLRKLRRDSGANLITDDDDMREAARKFAADSCREAYLLHRRAHG